MSNDLSRSRKLFSLISLVAVTCALLPQDAWSQSQYVTDYGKKPIPKPAPGTTTNTTLAPVKAAPAARDAKSDAKADGKTDGKADGKTEKTAAAPKTMTIVKPIKHVSAGPKWNQFADYIILKPGQENLPLTMTVVNGVEGTSPLRAIRAQLAGRSLFNEKSFKGKNTLVLDMSDTLTAGSTQVVFQAWGDAGSAFSWDLISKATPTITGLNPKQAGYGASVKAVGKLLPTDVKSFQVTVGGKPASIVSATPEAVEFRVPTDGLKPDSKGEVPVIVTVAGVKAKAQQLKLASEPEITAFSHISIPGAQTMTISGKNFGTDASKVKVTFGGTPAAISSVSDSSIMLTTPDISDIPSRQEVVVEVNGLKCKKPGTMFFSMRNVENSDSYSPFSVPNQFE